MPRISYCIFLVALVSGARHPRHADSCNAKTTANPASITAGPTAIEWVYVTEYTTVYPTTPSAVASLSNAKDSSSKQYSAMGSSSAVSQSEFIQYGSGRPGPAPTSSLYNSSPSISVIYSEKHEIVTTTTGGSSLAVTSALSQYPTGPSLSVSPLRSAWGDVPIHGPAPRASSSIMYSNSSFVGGLTPSSALLPTLVSTTTTLNTSLLQKASLGLLTYDPFKGRTTLKITTPPWRTALADSPSAVSSALYTPSVSSSSMSVAPDPKPQTSQSLSIASTTTKMSFESPTPQIIIVPVTLTPSLAVHGLLPRATMTISSQSDQGNTDFRAWKRDETSNEDDIDGTDALHSEIDVSDQYSTSTSTTTQTMTISTDRLPASESSSQSHTRRSSVKSIRTSTDQSKASTKTRTTRTASPTSRSGSDSSVATSGATDVLCPYYPYPHCKSTTTLRNEPTTTQEEKMPEASRWCPYPNQVC
jgi:hypothetical protein